MGGFDITRNVTIFARPRTLAPSSSDRGWSSGDRVRGEGLIKMSMSADGFFRPVVVAPRYAKGPPFPAFFTRFGRRRLTSSVLNAAGETASATILNQGLDSRQTTCR